MSEVPPGGIVEGNDGVVRCWWSGGDPLYRAYHDDEWGRPVRGDHGVFERIALEGFQSGLSWLTILRKREAFRRAFAGFDIEAVARFTPRRVEKLMADASIVRNRAKIEATINNARRALALVEETGSLAGYVWSFEPPARSGRLDWDTLSAITSSDEARAMSKDLKRRGWSFVGPTTIYSAMEAMGLVNDHLAGCDARAGVERARARFRRPGSAREVPS